MPTPLLLLLLLQDADLILVEYSLNGCLDPSTSKIMCHSTAMPQVLNKLLPLHVWVPPDKHACLSGTHQTEQQRCHTVLHKRILQAVQPLPFAALHGALQRTCRACHAVHCKVHSCICGMAAVAQRLRAPQPKDSSDKACIPMYTLSLLLYFHAAVQPHNHVVHAASNSVAVDSTAACNTSSHALTARVALAANGREEHLTAVYAAQVAGYEALLRRLIRTAPNAALMAVAMFDIRWLSVSHHGTATATMQLPNSYYSSGE